MSSQRKGEMNKLVGVLLVIACLGCTSGCRTSKEGYVAKGNKLYGAGKYDEAIINYGKALQKDERYGEAYYRLGLAEIKAQHANKAFDALYRAVPLLSTNIEAKKQLGALSLEFYLLDQHRPQLYYNLVKQTSDDLLQKNPRSFEGLREKAYLAVTDGKRDEAIALFRKALEVNPSDAIVTTAMIQNLIVTGQGQEAEKLATGPDRPPEVLRENLWRSVEWYSTGEPAGRRREYRRPESAIIPRTAVLCWSWRRTMIVCGSLQRCKPPCSNCWTIPRIFPKDACGWAIST